jgi:hypothetical protein
MQHLRVDGYQPSFVVSGAGGAGRYDLKPTKRGFVDNRFFGFSHVHVTPDRLDVQFVNADGECVHRFERDLAGKTTILS